MRIGELVSGLRCMITNEQRVVFEMLKEMNSLVSDDLDERTRYIAERMHTQGLIDRRYDEETKKVSYCLYRR